ncbi:LysR family transcriptional regulator [Silvibacterium sp.]|uniref:LysR family transcriptional regulator n=1 Tax=Silvibacterium sp. TaxID=1964179 RepID=UPI0039E5BE69
MMDERNLRSFVAAAETLNFRAAARKVHLSQPALSKQIRQLEDETELMLFTREHARVRLTPAGAALLERARELLRAASAAVLEARQVQEGLQHPVTIGFVAQAAFEALPSLVERCRRAAPEAMLQYREMSSRAQFAALRERTIDVGLVQVGTAPAEFASAVVARERFALVHSTRHRLGRAATVSLKDFHDEMLFLPEPEESPGIREVILANFARHGGAPTRFQAVERVQTAVCLAAAGLGIALVPESARAMRLKGAKFRRLQRPVLPVETRVVWRRGERAPVLVALQAGFGV